METGAGGDTTTSILLPSIAAVEVEEGVREMTMKKVGGTRKSWTISSLEIPLRNLGFFPIGNGEPLKVFRREILMIRLYLKNMTLAMMGNTN